jgi:hypothetical protein
MTWLAPLMRPDWVQRSPLALLVESDHRVDHLLRQLASQLTGLVRADENGSTAPTLELSRQDIEHARAHWEDHVLAGERRLYDLATLLARRLTGTLKVQLVARLVAGPREEEESEEARIVIEEPISREMLERVTDFTLAARIARHYLYRPQYTAPFGKLYPRASFLEFRPLEANDSAPAARVLTRVKANDQIWNKVCDALFDIDALAVRDKLFNTATKYVKDVFGIKVLTARNDESYQAHQMLLGMQLSADDLAFVKRPGAHAELELLEHKDYLSLPTDQKKLTGWEAIKNVYRWDGQLFEVQIQTEANYFLEVADLTQTSHRTFEMQRRNLRRQLEERVPHYRDFRMLLKSVFAPKGDVGDIPLPSWLRILE